MNLINKIYEIVWDPYIWYPPGITWEIVDQARNLGYHVARASDLYFAPIMVLVMLLVRKLVTKFIGEPLGRLFLNKTQYRSKYEPNPELEIIYKKHKKQIFDGKFDELALPNIPRSCQNWSKFRIARWYRRRRNADRLSRLTKFTESFWRFFYFFSMSVYGFIHFRDADFVKNPYNLWQDFPCHHLTTEAKIFYMIQIGFYGSLFCTLFTDVRRKDFVEQVLHHCVTMSLLIGSFIAGFWRAGILLELIYDPVDWIIEISKMLVYCRKKLVADFVISIFGITWIYTRLYLSVKYIAYTTFYIPFTLDFESFVIPIHFDNGLPLWPVFIIFNFFILALHLQGSFVFGPFSEVGS